MKRLLTLGLGSVAIVFCGLYVRERNKSPKEVERIMERKVEVPVQVIKEVKVPVEIVKEIPAAIPSEYQKAYYEKLLMNEAQKDAFQRAVTLESTTQNAQARISAYMQVVAMDPSSAYGKAASDRVAQIESYVQTLLRESGR